LIYAPTLTEQARQDFVLSVKLLTNGAVQQRVRDAYAQRVRPTLVANAREPKLRRDIAVALGREPEYRHWAAFTHSSQSMMWQAVEVTAQRSAANAEQSFESLLQSQRRRGSLELAPDLTVPTPIANTEIHRQPGGFVGRANESSFLPGLRYFGSSRIYAPGKGAVSDGTDARGAFLLEQVRREFPQLQPRRVLDLGCGLGVASQYVAQGFPNADYHAVDVAGPVLKMAHLLAEERGVKIHYYQRDAAATGFPDVHFDLVVSHIMFHETNSARLPQILRECRRVLAPGGAMLHVDVATQTHRLGLDDQLMNDWQVRWNGEPFWTAFAEIDMRAQMLAAGFDAARIFANYRAKPGAGVSYVFGASV
jgi:ubiquinone/menaquinone biosynthesis C-methylase UbiE